MNIAMANCLGDIGARSYLLRPTYRAVLDATLDR